MPEVGIKIDVIIIGFPISGILIGSGKNDFIFKIFKAKFPEGSKQSQKAGPFDDKFKDAFEYVSETFGYESSANYQWVDSFDLTHSRFKAPWVISSIFNFFSDKKVKKTITYGDKKELKVNVKDFKENEATFAAHFPIKDVVITDGSLKSNLEVYLIWALRNGLKLGEYDPKFYKKIEGSDNEYKMKIKDDAKLSDSYLTLMHTWYNNQFDKMADIANLPYFLITKIEDNFLNNVFWENLLESKGLRLVVFEEHSLKFGVFKYKSEYLPKQHWAAKIDIKVATPTLARAEQDWQSCHKDATITWKEWLVQPYSEGDALYKMSGYTKKDRINEGKKDPIEPINNKGYLSDFLGKKEFVEKINFYGDAEFIIKWDVASAEREALSFLYRNSPGLAQTFPLNQKWKKEIDEKLQFYIPSIEEQVIIALEEFS